MTLRTTLFSICLGLGALAPCAMGSLTSLNYPSAIATRATGINNSGEIVGYYEDSGGVFHGFTDIGGIFTSIDYPGASITQIFGVNSAGVLVGSFNGNAAFEDNQGVFSVLPGTAAEGINSVGQVVGNSGGQGYLDTGGTVTTLSDPSGTSTFAFGINNAGTIVGDYVSGTNNGYVYSGGVFTTLNVPGSSLTIIRGINNNGLLGGQYAQGGTHGFLDNNGVFTTVDFPGAISTLILGVNDLGQAVGVYVDANGESFGFFDDALPEPGSFILMGAGLTGIVLLRWKARQHGRSW